jgi:hypothetical protein
VKISLFEQSHLQNVKIYGKIVCSEQRFEAVAFLDAYKLPLFKHEVCCCAVFGSLDAHRVCNSLVVFCSILGWLFYFHAKLNFAAATQKLLAQVDTRSGVQSFSHKHHALEREVIRLRTVNNSIIIFNGRNVSPNCVFLSG